MGDETKVLAAELVAVDSATPVFTKVQAGMDMLAKSGTVLKDVLGALGIGFGIERIAAFAEHAIKLGEDLYKLHERTGFTVEGLSEVRLAANLAGVEFDAVGSSITKFEKNLVEASNETTKMGKLMTALSVDITQGPQKAFEQFVKTANTITDPALKVAAFKEAFGKTGDQMILVAGDLDRAEKAAKALGITMNEETAKSAKELADNMKLLKTGGDALAVLFLGEMAKGALTLSGNLVQAAESGHKFWGVLNEINKDMYALIGMIPGLDNFAFAGFEALDKLGRPSGVSGKIRGADGKPVGEKESLFSEDEIRKILASMDGKGKVDDSAARERARLLKMDEDNLLKSTQAKIDADDAFYKFQGEMRDKDAEEAKRLLDQDVKNLLAATEAKQAEDDRYYTELSRHYDEMAKQTKKTKGFMEDLGFTMISSFENAIVSGKKFGDVLQSLLKDIEKVILRKGVLDPLGNAAGDWFKGVFSNDEGGATQLAGPRAAGGPVDAGSSYLVGENGPEIFTPRTSGAIVPNSQLGGRAVTNVFNFNGGPPTNAQDFLAAVVPVMNNIANSAIARQLRPGGVLV
jgi:hypothetical protein